MEIDNSPAAKGNELMSVVICDLVGRLEVRRCTKYRDGEPPKTYGNVPPDDMSYEAIDQESLNKTKAAQEEIWKLAKEQPETMPLIVAELVNKGIYYESSAHEYYSMGKEAQAMRNCSESRSDSLWSCQIVAETVVSIGKPALPFLEERDEPFVKGIRSDLRKKVNSEKRREKFEQMGSQIGRFFSKH